MRLLAFELRRFAADERGIFGVIFAIMAVVLVAMSGAVVDFVTVEQARTRSQVALDAAALALQQKMSQTPQPTQTTLQEQAQRLLEQQVNDPTIAATVTAVNPNFDTGTIDIQAKIDVPTNFVRLVGVSHLQASLLSEATRGSTNLEVALALDVTGSMQDATKASDGTWSTKIADLREATSELIDLVVKDVQTPAYTKMAFAPYSTAVNVGAYAAQVRGPVQPGQAISNAVWKGDAETAIGKATAAYPVKISTALAHGLADGDWVYISGVNGMRQINNKAFKVTGISNANSKAFTLQTASGADVDGSGYDSYVSGGTVTKCRFPKCEVQVTVNNNTFADGDYVRITGVGGLSNINDTTFAVASRTASTFILGGSVGGGNYTSGGTAWCVIQGCEYYYFRGPGGDYKTFRINTCATERTTTSHAFDDTAPSVTPLGPNYTRNGDCVVPEIVPLTTDKTALHDVASSLRANGSTAGHLGLAWAWYMVSPNFAYLWPNDSKPAAYDAPNVQKVVILMTDGAFNTVYCNGVVATNSTSGSPVNSERIDCPSPNGNIFDQAKKICDEMKTPHGDAPPVVVYTVGFDIGNDQNAKNIMSGCATDAAHAYLANTGADLREAFRAIGENITSLRVSR